MECINISRQKDRSDGTSTSHLPVTGVSFKLETCSRTNSFFDVELNNLKRAYGLFLEPSDSIHLLKEGLVESEHDDCKDDQRSIQFHESQLVEEDNDLRSSTKNNDDQYKCCNRYFDGPVPNFKDHLKFCNQNQINPMKSNLKEQLVNLQNQTEEQIFDCSQCGKKFKRQSLLLAHLPVHDKIKRFKCQVCDKVFPAYRYLVRHLERHEKKVEVKREVFEHGSYKCNVCQKCFTKKESMIKHTRIHTRDLLKCGQCEFTCSKKVALKMHVVSHEGNRKYKCDLCDFSFKQIGHLKRHMARFKH